MLLNVTVAISEDGSALTLTVVESEAVPPAPVQTSVKVLVTVIDCVVWLPDVGLDPLHAPEAVQDVAFVDDQDNPLVAPEATEAGFALRVTVGAGVALVTVTVTDFAALPALPVQVKVNVLDVVMAGRVSTPAVARLPLQAPDALQLVALVEDQLMVVEDPLASVVGFAVNVTVGASTDDTVTVTLFFMVLPSTPRQVKVKRVVAVRFGMVWEPESGFRPFHTFEPQHKLVPVLVQESVVLPPDTTVVGLAVRIRVGADEVETVIVADAVALPPVPLHVRV